MKMERKLTDMRDEGLFKGQLGCGSKRGEGSRGSVVD